MESILTSIKKLLGSEELDTSYDTDITVCINGVFLTLTQLGVGPSDGFSIADKTKTWTDYLGSDKNLEAVKLFIFYKTKLAFDPPSSSFVIAAMERQAAEIEWRLNIQVDKPVIEPVIEEVL